VSLKDRLVRDIREDGPMTVADYMTRCLHDPLDGYYATRPALGETGDFITAPLISQMFGEIVGAWTHEIWVRLGAPKRFRLIELGPGTGVLMADILRVSRLDAAFAAACEPWLVERGAPLRALQAAAVPGARWADRLDAVPGEAPTVIVANEFLDCLPIRQAIARAGGWRERRVGLADDGSLAFVEGPTWGDFQPPRAARPDEVWEWSARGSSPTPARPCSSTTAATRPGPVTRSRPCAATRRSWLWPTPASPTSRLTSTSRPSRRRREAPERRFRRSRARAPS
jgi:NADH dehydrogenase [ubiquinone] 1 alpha subcomplex assembly factor 7